MSTVPSSSRAGLHARWATLLAGALAGCGTGDDAATRAGLSGPADDDASADPAPAELTCSEPAALYDEVWWSRADGLYRASGDGAAQALDRWPAGAAGTSPVVAPSPRAGDVEVVVALRAADGGCELRGYDRDGARRWLTREDGPGACQRPAIRGRLAWWPVGGDVAVVSLASGVAGARVALTAPATTPLVPIDLPDGELEGGGSHWLVGVGERVSVIEGGPVPSAGASLAIPDGVVTALVPLGSGLVAAVARAAPERGFGSTLRLIALAPDGQALRPSLVGEALSAPGSIMAHPVALGCDALAGGGSHWWCPSALLAAAGDGWLRAWRMPEGALAFEDVTPERGWSGLAFGDDGRLAAGGAAWRPGKERWQLVLEGPTAQGLQPAGGEGLACSRSLLVGGDGVTTTLERDGAAEPIAVASDLRAAGAGWPRPGGASDNAAVAASPSCVDGAERGLRWAETNALVNGVVLYPESTLLIGADGSPGATRAWLGWLDGDGIVRDELHPSANPTALMYHAAALGADALADWIEGNGDPDPRRLVVARIARGAASADVLATLPLADGREPVDLVVAGSDALVPYHGTDGDGVLRVALDGSGTVEGPRFTTAPFGVERFAVEPSGGYVMAGEGTGFLWLRALDASAAERWVDQVDLPGSNFKPHALGVSPDGVISIFTMVLPGHSGTPDTAIYRWSSDGAELAPIQLGPRAFGAGAVDADGAMLLVGNASAAELVLQRIGPHGEVGLERPFTSPRAVSFRWLFPTATGFVAAGTMNTGWGSFALARFDARGFVSCEAAGRCVWSADDACDGGDACTRQGCDPATGACATSAIDAPDCPSPR
ncbi:MAG: hypothetical protein U1F43_04170 [Myxococcota bacterium]